VELSELFDKHGLVEQLEFREEFFEHMADRGTYDKHVVSVTEILEAHSGGPRYFENSAAGRAPVIMLGITATGRLLCVPIEPSAEREIWNVVTAFEANAHHRERYFGGKT
jgi:hypothetical protein